MSAVNIESLKFPSGRSVSATRKDAKRLSKKEGIPLSEAQDKVARDNGFNLAWDKAINYLRKIHSQERPHQFSRQPNQATTVFYCDACGKPIDRISDGYVIWKKASKTSSILSGFKIIHQNICDDLSFSSSMPLDRFLGNDGLNYALSMLSYGPLLSAGTETNSGLKVKDFDEYVDFLRRLHLPLYEEARRRFDIVKSEELFEECNEYSPYTHQSLMELVNMG